MPETALLDDQLRRSFHGEAWHGPCLQDALADVSAAEAAAHPLAGAHSIWEIVLHLATWQDVVRRRAAGKAAGEVADARDWPAPGGTDEAWQTARERLAETHAALRSTAARLAPERLDELAEGGTDTVQELILGLLQHDAYHAGQIVLLKKALRTGG